MENMRYIKTNTQQEADVICQRIFDAANVDGKFQPGTTSYAIPELITYYSIPVLEGFESYFTNLELSGADQFSEEKQSRTVIDDLLLALKGEGLTPANMATLLNTILLVMVLLLSGSLRAARVAANNIATTALFTAARKTWLLNRIDAEIAKL